MFLDNQGRSCRYLYALNTHLTNRNKKNHINEVFFFYWAPLNNLCSRLLAPIDVMVRWHYYRILLLSYLIMYCFWLVLVVVCTTKFFW